MTKVRKIIITLMLAFYLAVTTCDRSCYISYSTTYHSIVLDNNPDPFFPYPDDPPVKLVKPGRYVKHPALFLPGLNMMTINQYRFSLN